MKTAIFTFSFLVLSFLLIAQWSTDPTENNPIALASGEEAIPKIATSENGTTYISWFSNVSGNYNVRLQKLDVFGNFQWDSAGLLVSDHPSMTWLTEWDMTIDHENCAILTFQDVRNVDNDVFSYRISPDGDFLYGADGIEMSTGPAFDVSPKVTVTNANNAVFAWQAEDVVILQKISPDGNKLWGENGITLSSNNTLSWPQLIAVGDDEIILKYFDDYGPPYSPTRYVYAQRYDSNGDAVWAQPTVISNAAGISAWTQVFSFINDGNDGFYIGWHDDRDMDNQSSIFVHHIGSDGAPIFMDDGVEASLASWMNHFYAQLALPPESDDIFVYWRETNLNQSSWGIYGQKLSATGERLWTDNGKSFIDVSDISVDLIASRNSNDDMVVFYEEYSDVMNAGIKAMRIDTDGNFVWENEKVDMCTVQSEKVHPYVNQLMNGQWIAAWEDSRNGGRDIYAQNIQLDGSLGPITGGELDVYPDTLFFEMSMLILPFKIVNNTFETFTITDMDEIGIHWGLTEPLPSIPYDLLPGDSLVMEVEVYILLYSQFDGYIYENLNIVSYDETYTIVIAMDEDLFSGNSQFNMESSLVNVYPNPTYSTVKFDFNQQCNNCLLNISNQKGQLIKEFILQGHTSVLWDGSNEFNQKVTAGIYYYKLISDKHQESGKIILLE